MKVKILCFIFLAGIIFTGGCVSIIDGETKCSLKLLNIKETKTTILQPACDAPVADTLIILP